MSGKEAMLRFQIKMNECDLIQLKGIKLLEAVGIFVAAILDLTVRSRYNFLLNLVCKC